MDKAFFQLDMAYENFKDLTRKTASDKILHYTAFNIDKNTKNDGYQSGLASMVYKFFDKKLPLRAQINFLVVVLEMRTFQTKS